MSNTGIKNLLFWDIETNFFADTKIWDLANDRA